MSLLRVIQTALGKKGYGYKPDLPDKRDLLLSAHLGAAKAPPSASVANPKVAVKDQGSTSSCTGQATSQALRCAYLKQGIDCPELSALFPYDMGRGTDGMSTDDGAVIRDVIKGVVQWGEASEAAWPFSVGGVNKHPTLKAYQSAYDRRGPKLYHRINQGDINGVRLAIAAGYPVIAGWNLSQSFEDWNGKGVIGAQKTPFVGGHCMMIESYAADDTFDLLNSWSARWGINGRARVNSAFVAQATDLWAIQIK